MNIKRYFLTATLLFLPMYSYAGSIISVGDVPSFKNDISIDIGLSHNQSSGNVNKVDSGFNGQVVQNGKRYQNIGLLGYNYSTSLGVKSENSSFVHLRHRSFLSDMHAYEFFAQIQSNEFAALSKRELYGFGFFVMPYLDVEDYIFYGIDLMYENEKLTNGQPENKGFRGNFYLKGEVGIDDNISLLESLYYQPSIIDVADYRLINNLSLDFTVNKNVSLRVSYIYLYDSSPALGVESWDSSIKTVLNYKF